ncbi:MAG: MOSC domain-containing protein [Candidatus Dormibacteraeota bacterium]|nr:MOSC domain-containing protein [Candidatus Dormibacteraeota bacterium]
MGEVAEIWRYPVKSMAGEQLESCAVRETGLDGDRRWALVDGTVNRAGKLLTNTQDARLMTYKARLAGGAVDVLTPAGRSRRLGQELVAELADAIARPLTLRDTAGVNFDDSPVLVVNLATVSAFSVVAGMPVDHRRFRGNFYIEGLEPEEELSWVGRRIRTGEVELEVVKRCERCAVVTRDPETTVASPALLRVLTETSDTFMGVYCRVVRPGHVAMGDSCEPV